MASTQHTVAAPRLPETGPDDVVLVVPCYNEVARLDRAAFVGYQLPARRLLFLFVNDGSRDGTLALLNDLVRERPGGAFVLDLPRNAGKAEAVRQGLLLALGSRARTLGFWDADLATPLAELPRLCEVLERRPEVDLVLGSRVRLLGRSIERSALRHYLGRVFATGASLTLGLPVYDTQCGAKLLRVSEALPRVLERPFLTRWVFDVELLARYARIAAGSPLPLEKRVYELPLQQWTDVPGSKVRPWDFVRSGLELVKIWRAYRR